MQSPSPPTAAQEWRLNWPLVLSAMAGLSFGAIPSATLGLFILLGNLISLVPGMAGPTTNLNTTAACAIVVFLAYHYIGIRKQGLVTYAKHFMGPVPALAPLMIPIELISHLARPLSLTLRLFGNIFGEHLVVLILASLVPFILPLPIQFLGLIVGPLQAFIFLMLGAIYLTAATHVDSHGDELGGVDAHHPHPQTH